MNSKTFKVSAVIIWLSSLSLGILVMVPKIAEQHFSGSAALADGLVTSLYTLFVWYFNIYSLPKFSKFNYSNGVFLSVAGPEFTHWLYGDVFDGFLLAVSDAFTSIWSGDADV